jgi:small-conductance mechanosensitive channel/CRP-like cAMP-binding protein
MPERLPSAKIVYYLPSRSTETEPGDQCVKRAGERLTGEILRQIGAPALEGMLALAAALSAVAFRRRTRMFTPAGFIMLALGLTLNLMVPRGPGSPDWVLYLRAAAIVLLWFGVIRLGVESIEFVIRRRREHVSTIATELILTLLYAATILVVTRNILSFDLRRLVAIPALFALARAWLQQHDLFSGLLIQSQRPFRPGDWVRFGSQVGQVQGAGWRATRILTQAQESVTIPSGVLAKDVLTNYSASGHVAGEIFIERAYEEPPGEIETVVQRVLDGIPEILKEPPPEVSPWEYGDSSLRYRIRYWLADYANYDGVRTRIIRSLWYALQRHSLDLAPHMSPPQRNNNGTAGDTETRLMEDLRVVDLLKGLSDEDLRIVIPSIKLSQFGRGEVLIRQGETGDRFFILRRGRVEVVEEPSDGRAPTVVAHIDHLSEKNFFGEIALLKGEPRTTTVRAVTDVEVLEINRLGFSHLFKARPEIAVKISVIAAAREEETQQRASAAINSPTTVRERQSRTLETMRRIFDF